jgi:hypothetical protein
MVVWLLASRYTWESNLLGRNVEVTHPVSIGDLFCNLTRQYFLCCSVYINNMTRHVYLYMLTLHLEISSQFNEFTGSYSSQGIGDLKLPPGVI